MSQAINKKIDQLERQKKNNTKTLLIYINYSGKNDIEHAALKYRQNFKKNNKFNNYLLTSGIPDPDILIRTGGFSRLSDFLIYQSSFTELFFKKIY